MSPIDEHLAIVGAAIANIALKHVVPLFSLPPKRRPVLAGTGFFVSAHGQSYLVSATHVLDHLLKPGSLHYYVEPHILRRVTGRVLRSDPPPGANRTDDRLDIGVVRLVGSRLPPYPAVQKALLPLSALRPWALPRSQKQYMVVGFPESKSRPNPKSGELPSKASAFSAPSPAVTEYARLGVGPESHLVLSVDVKRMSVPGGAIQAIADPHGMSGSPVWLLYDEVEPNDPTSTPVVGILIEHHKAAKAVVATDIAYAIRLINEAALTL